MISEYGSWERHMVRGLGNAEAIVKVLVPGRPANKFPYMGSVKTNIGHTEAASWIAAIIEMIFALFMLSSMKGD